MKNPPSKRVRPLVSYYGGKQRMAPKIVPLLPEHTVYVEPFAGGAAVLFAKPKMATLNNNHYREVLNDTFDALTKMYAYARDNPAKFAELISLTPYSAGTFALAKKISKLESPDMRSSAWATYVLLQQSFGKEYARGWGTSVYGANDASTFASKTCVDALERLQGIYIESTDAIKCIKRWDSPQTMFYCDPPYIGTECGHYKGYTPQDFKNLIAALDACDGSFVLSGYDSAEVSLPASWEKVSFDSYCSVSSEGRTGRKPGRRHQACPADSVRSRKRTEVVYRRFNKVPWRSELEKLRQKGVYSCFAPNPESPPHQGIFSGITK